METDIGNPIEYNPTIDPLNQEKEEEEDKHEQPYYFHPSEMNQRYMYYGAFGLKRHIKTGKCNYSFNS